MKCDPEVLFLFAVFKLIANNNFILFAGVYYTMAQEVVGMLFPIALAVTVPMVQTDARSFGSWKILRSTGSYTVPVYPNLVGPVLIILALVRII